MLMSAYLNFPIIFCLVDILSCQVLTREDAFLSRIVKPNIVDHAVPYFRNKNKSLKRMLRSNSISGRRQRAVPENSQYKCQVLTSLYVYWRTNFKASPKNVAGSRLDNLINDCKNPTASNSSVINQTTIFPGTKWCGQSNVAKDYHDLGFFNETDACCREHDFCDDIIQPGKSKHNLINPYSTTRLNCECDETLRKCFRNVNSVISNTMGYVFFSMLQTQCFKFEYPATGCEQWKPGSVRLYCVKYKLDTSKPKKWQWFDQAPYF